MVERKADEKQIKSGVKAFSVPLDLGEQKDSIFISKHIPSETSKERLINQIFDFLSKGNISEAARYCQHFINQGFKDYRIFSNYGLILSDLNKPDEAENIILTKPTNGS